MNLPPTAARVLTCLKGQARRGVVDILQRDLVIQSRVSYGSMYAGLRMLEELGVIETMRDLADRRRVRYRLKKTDG